MSINVDPLLLKILQACRGSEPAALYPRDFAEAENVERARLDAALDHLRLTGLVTLTDWQAGVGQGYTLTDEGKNILESPWLLNEKRVPVPQPMHARRDDMDLAGTPWQRGEQILESLRNPTPPRVTRFLLIANIGIFILGAFLVNQRGGSVGAYLSGQPDRVANQVQIEMGTLKADSVFEGQWWRLISHAFLHGGFFHILLNMYFLYNVGPMLESIWGSVRFTILYLVSALAGGILGVLIHQNGLGASGALCGLITSLAAWIWLNRAYMPPELASRWLGNVMMNIVLIAMISFMPRVGWAGHLGGAVAGVLLTVPLNLTRYGTAGQKFLGFLGLAAAPILLLIPLIFMTEGEVLRYRVAPDLHEVERRLIPAYNRFAIPLKEGKLQEIVDDPERLEEAKKDFAGILEDLQGLETRLNGYKFKEDGPKKNLELVRRYVKAWQAYADQTMAILLNPAGFGRDQRNALNRQEVQLWEEHRPLRENDWIRSKITFPVKGSR